MEVSNTVNIGLSQHCMLGEDNLFLEFHMFTDEEELCIGRTVPGASPIPNLDYLMMRFGTFGLIVFK